MTFRRLVVGASPGSMAGRATELDVLVTTGIDLTRIHRLAALAANAGFLRRVFAPSELDDTRPEHLAGIFAAKEAVFKALGQPPRWQTVTIARGPRGRPRVLLSQDLRDAGLQALDVSISHEGDYAIAVAVAVFDREARPA